MNILYDYENRLSGVSGNFQDVDTSLVVQELNKWSGKNEEDPSMYNTLKSYWDYVQFGPNWSPSETAWSSAFISYVLQNEQFPKRSAHYLYIQDIMNDNYPSWKAFSIPKSTNLKLNIGDVLIRPRTSSNTATHGDIVMKIEDNKAFLVGGNVSNTSKIVKVIDLNNDRSIKKPIEKYLIILKKKGTGYQNIIIGSLLTLVLVGMFVRTT